MRHVLVQLVGAMLIAAGFALIWLPVGLIVAGALCVLFGVALELRKMRARSN